MDFFIDSDWIDFDQGAFSHDPLDRDVANRAYDMWRHAESKIRAGASDMDRADSILWLNRAVSLRTRSLSKDYNLRGIARCLAMKKSSHAETVADIGLIRPGMLRALTVLRNAVEHEDAEPPTLARCSEFGEFVWYFLRSTDDLATMRLLDLELGGSEHPGAACVEFKPGEPSLTVFGSMSLDRVAWTPVDEWTRISPDRKPRIRSGRVYFDGSATGSTVLLTRIWKRYFRLDRPG